MGDRPSPWLRMSNRPLWLWWRNITTLRFTSFQESITEAKDNWTWPRPGPFFIGAGAAMRPFLLEAVKPLLVGTQLKRLEPSCRIVRPFRLLLYHFPHIMQEIFSLKPRKTSRFIWNFSWQMWNFAAEDDSESRFSYKTDEEKRISHQFPLSFIWFHIWVHMNFYENLCKLNPRIITGPRRPCHFAAELLLCQEFFTLWTFFDAAAV